MEPWLPSSFWVRPSGAAAPAHTGLLLHGILGSARNLRTIATQLSARLPRWQWLLVDLRNHGDSSSAPPPHTVHACVSDLAALCDHLGLQPAAAIGHSFGGKIALELASPTAAAAWPQLKQVWALDTQPHLTAAEDRALSTTGNGAAAQVIAALRECPGPFASRSGMADQLLALGLAPGVAQWMTTNLAQHPDGLHWRFDLPAVEQMLLSYFETDSWPILAASAPGVDLHLLRAGREPRWTPQLVEQLDKLSARQPRLHVHVLPNSGHWVHVDDPTGLLNLLTANLQHLQPADVLHAVSSG